MKKISAKKLAESEICIVARFGIKNLCRMHSAEVKTMQKKHAEKIFTSLQGFGEKIAVGRVVLR
jgi:hypothetical protein